MNLVILIKFHLLAFIFYEINHNKKINHQTTKTQKLPITCCQNPVARKYAFGAVFAAQAVGIKNEKI